ncbi:MAG: tRNA-dihydrouridine synthase family protein, partial [Deltaproteobacteria bacterium]
MLAPMQGVTNRELRAVILQLSPPDVVFTEFLRVSPVSRKRFSRRDLEELDSEQMGTPLVVQLIGGAIDPLLEAADIAVDRGARHINLNLGCPYGRATSAATGGKLLRHPDILAELLPALRRRIPGDFSVKMRAGYDDPRQVFSLLPLLEDAGIDWLILHPRTVVQKYAGRADHDLTAEVIVNTRIPVIANGDIRSGAEGRQILDKTGAAGLMIGRSALCDPWIFDRIRGRLPDREEPEIRLERLRQFMERLVPRYQERFCGEKQVLDKIKNVLIFIEDEDLAPLVRRLKKSRQLPAFWR